MRAEAGARPVRGSRSERARRLASRALPRSWRWALWALVAVLGGVLAAGLLFAGSTDRVPAGVTIAGVPLGGLTAGEAAARLETRAARLASQPVEFIAGGKRWLLEPSTFEVSVDWRAVVAQAQAAGDAPLPFRGLKRVKLRLFGLDLDPHAEVYDAALDFQIGAIARELAVPAREAAIVLRGLRPVVVPAQAGRELDAERARARIVESLTGFEREPVRLPIRLSPPSVPTSALVPVAAAARRALSGPVRFGFNDSHWRVTRFQLAKFLALPRDGSRTLAIEGSAAERYFARLARAVDREPVDAGFAARADGSVEVIPSAAGRTLDVEATEKSLLAAAVSAERRDAELVVRTVEPERTAAEARAMGIERVLASYGTAYAGTADRIQNLQLAVSSLDGTLVAPGATFSFNQAVGPRTEERGFRAAPVIIGGEYEEGIGGGVSQVATTVFNAAWEAGLKITERAAHALYISRYPLGRDATVNYPDLDLQFVNDTGRWILLRAYSGETGIAVSILGADLDRRVSSEPGALHDVAAPKLEKVLDPTLPKGETVVEDYGEPARSVTVRRTVYQGDEVLYDESWTTTYRSEPRIVRVGTRPLPEEPVEQSKEERPDEVLPLEPAPPADVAPGGEPAQPAPAGPLPGEAEPAPAGPAPVAPGG